MYIVEYITDWDNGESVLNRIECETHTDAEMIISQARHRVDEFTTWINHSFRCEIVEQPRFAKWETWKGWYFVMGKALNLKNMIAAYEAVYVNGLEIGQPWQDIEETARDVWAGFYTMCKTGFIPWETWDKFFDRCKAIDCGYMAETSKEDI